MQARQPVDTLLTDPETSESLRENLLAIDRALGFARELGLEVDDQYTSYVEWPGDRIITTVVATRPGEVDPSGFWFPILGRLPYKGFFDQARADRFAEELRADGLDVCVVGVRAYSTLGWLADPVTAPMLRSGEGRTIETVFHELVHATVYVKDHIDFNETVASFIGQEASVRFYAETVGEAAAAARRRDVEDNRALAETLISLRDRVADLYASSDPGPAQTERRAQLAAATRAEIAGLRFGRLDASYIAETIELNDACLALSGTYGADAPRYVERLAELDGDLRAFIALLRSAEDVADPPAALLGP